MTGGVQAGKGPSRDDQTHNECNSGRGPACSVLELRKDKAGGSVVASGADQHSESDCKVREDGDEH